MFVLLINRPKNYGHKFYVMNNTKVNFTIDAASFVNLKGANFSGLTRHAEISVNDSDTWGKGLTPLFSQLVQSMFKGIAKGQPIDWAMSVINESGSVLVEGSEVMKGDSVSTAKAIFKAIRTQFAPEVEGLDMQNLPKISAIKQAYKDAANKRLTFAELCEN
jgi:hypothetical protein